jgi:hypothetical protein
MVGVERAPTSPVEVEATAAAVAVARKLGLESVDPVLVGQSSNVLVHLRPAPVVARVMTATAALHADEEAWLTHELSVTGFAAAAGAPVVAPSDRLPPGPYQHDGLWLSFWELAAERTGGGELSGAEVGRSLKELHDALAGYEAADLPPFTVALGELGVTIDDERADLPWQALHGDTSLSNLLDTDRGPLWNDFEDVCRGPVVWDLAGVVQSAEQRGRPAGFAEEALDAYGHAPGIDDLVPFLEAHRRYHAAWARRQRNSA